MLDFSYLPKNQQDRQIFYNSAGSGGGTSWQTWQKPRGAKMIYIFCLAGGGGGGGGVNPGEVYMSGGAGGGSGAYSTGLYPAFAIPDTLYVLVGWGGAGSAVRNGVGTAGVGSIVALAPYNSSNITNINPSASLQFSGTGGVGGKGGAAATAPGGVGGTVWAINTFAFPCLGITNAIKGVDGSDSTTTAANAGTKALSTGIVMGGTGGGGRNGNVSPIVAFAGGSITSGSAFIRSDIPGGAPIEVSQIGTGSRGVDGIGSVSPIFYGIGGTGGGASPSGPGGTGGDGFYGCGGGGGGACDAASAVGRGGNGGNGLVIITTIF